MPAVEVSIEVDAPIWRVYQNWKRLDQFPKFVPSVKEARWLSKKQLYWREEHEGEEHEFTYEVTLQLHENSLSWRSLSGVRNAGTAHCCPLPSGGTRLTLAVYYAPDVQFQSPAAVQARHREYLTAFKRFVETESGDSRDGFKTAESSPPR